MRALFVVVLGLFVVASCSRSEGKQSAASSAAPSAPPPPPVARSPASVPTPPLPKLKEDVRKLIPELREHIASGKAKPRSGDATCIADLVKRHGRLNTIMQTILGARLAGTGEPWSDWDEAQRDIADTLENVIIPLRMCVACSDDGIRDCATASAELGKLAKLVAAK